MKKERSRGSLASSRSYKIDFILPAEVERRAGAITLAFWTAMRNSVRVKIPAKENIDDHESLRHEKNKANFETQLRQGHKVINSEERS